MSRVVSVWMGDRLAAIVVIEFMIGKNLRNNK
jgi:hypothetical protein